MFAVATFWRSWRNTTCGSGCDLAHTGYLLLCLIALALYTLATAERTTVLVAIVWVVVAEAGILGVPLILFPADGGFAFLTVALLLTLLFVTYLVWRVAVAVIERKRSREDE
jgi:hypothetical protein